MYVFNSFLSYVNPGVVKFPLLSNQNVLLAITLRFWFPSQRSLYVVPLSPLLIRAYVRYESFFQLHIPIDESEFTFFGHNETDSV